MIHTIELDGRTSEPADLIKQRLRIGESTLSRWQQAGLSPVRIGKRRFFKRQAVDEWVLAQFQ